MRLQTCFAIEELTPEVLETSPKPSAAPHPSLNAFMI
jgi:hypothetical protein